MCRCNLRERAQHKRDIIACLELNADLLRAAHAEGPSYAPSRSSRADDRRFDDNMNQRKTADALGLKRATLTTGRTRYTLFPTPAAHENLAKALAKLRSRAFHCWSYEIDG